MKKIICVPLEAEEFESHLVDLTMEEHGLFLRLLLRFWQTGRVPKNETSAVQRFAGCTAEEFERAWPAVAPYFEDKDGRLVHAETEKALLKKGVIADKRAKAGSIGGLHKAKAQSGVSSKTLANAKANAKANARTVQAEPKSAAVWKAYSDAYYRRYQVEPVRNQSVNAMLCKFVDRVGTDDAPHVAAFYLEHNAQWYITKGHAVAVMLSDAEKLRTEWATGRKVTSTQARQIDSAENMLSIADELKKKYGTGDQ